jgi:hypothetical protein
MKKARLLAVIVLATLTGSALRTHAATALSDTFGSSTLNAVAPAAPTATSTDYAVLSSKSTAGTVIGAGSLKLNIAPTGSGLAEIQSRFSATPLSLAADGDYVELRATFVPTGILYIPSGNASFNAGLFNSHGTTPVTGGQLANGLLGSGTGQDGFATGFAAGWEGYATRVQATSSRVYTRPIQTDTTNESQDLLFSDSGGGAFDNPVGVTLSPNGTGVTFVNGSVYTYTFKLTRNGAALDVAQNVYDGADATGTNLLAHSTTSTASTPTTEFDGFAMGFRGINDTATPTTEHSLNFSLIEVTTNLAVAPAPNANFDGLGLVDGNDFLKWQQGLGLTGQTTNANGDANASGTVDASDLSIWRSRFGQASAIAAVAAVPEPASAALLAGLIACSYRRRR